MNWQEISIALAAGMITGAVLSLVVGLVARLTTGETNFVLDGEPDPTTTSPAAAICPCCGSPIDDEHHPTRNYETTSPPELKWSETYCGKPPHLKSRTPSR